MNRLGKPLLFLTVSGVTVWSFLVGDAPGFSRPELARIFFWHFPSSILLTFALVAGAWFSLRQFVGSAARDPGEKRRWDVRAQAALELGFAHSCVTMLSGIVFSYAQWNSPWHGDPRQTSFLLFLLLYAAYFALRGAMADPDRRAQNAAAYLLAAVGPMLFLVLVFPRIPMVARQSIHPTESIMTGQIRGGYAQVILALVALVSVVSYLLYRLRVRAGMLLLRKEENGNLETPRRRSAAPPVVRPLPLSEAGGPDGA